MTERLLISVALVFSTLFGSTQTTIELVNADRVTPGGENVYHFEGNVQFKHENAIMYCNHAFQYNTENRIEAYGNVRILQGDTLALYGDSLFYNGNTKIARLRGNVRLIEQDMSLSTNTLDYDLNTRIASYVSGGIINSKKTNNVLKSDLGSYHSPSKTLSFKHNVTLTNPEYVMECDTLQYNTLTESAHFLGPTTITSNTNFIYCENGWYNTKTEKAQFFDHSYIYSDGQILTGDSIFYDRKIGLGEAHCNVVLTDTINDVIIQGDYGFSDELNNLSMITGTALFTKIYETDSLILHSDTLYAYKDSAGCNSVIAYNHVKFLKSDMQGMCDSLTYIEKDSLITMYKNPVLWSDANQLTGNLVTLKTFNGKLDELRIYNTAFIASEADTLDQFNQVKGKNMTGFFKNDSLYKVLVEGNGESVYFAIKEDGTPIGMNKVECSDMLIFVDGNEIRSITFITKPDGITIPQQDINPKDKLLKGFRWESANRPASIGDLFNWTTEQ